MMDVQTRKLKFVQEFLKLQNTDIISKFEEMLNEENSRTDNDGLEKMSIKELNERIDSSLEDAKNGRLTDSNELLAEIEKWS